MLSKLIEFARDNQGIMEGEAQIMLANLYDGTILVSFIRDGERRDITTLDEEEFNTFAAIMGYTAMEKGRERGEEYKRQKRGLQ